MAKISEADFFQQALMARKNAHAPYSGFFVGAAIEADNGEVYVGCNVENAAYPLGNCAESSAIAAMVMGGGDKIKRIAIVGGPKEADELGRCPPCGGCRQRIAEFAEKDTQILLRDKDGQTQIFSMADLLPESFIL